jgi:hypothetical protein
MFPMKKALWLLVLLCIAAPLAPAQTTSMPGVITASSSDCSTAGSCVTFSTLPSASGIVLVDISGTFTGLTLNFEGSADATNWRALGCSSLVGGVSISNTSTTGAWQCNSGGLTGIRARASALSTGSARIQMQATPASVEALLAPSASNSALSDGSTVAYFVPAAAAGARLTGLVVTTTAAATAYVRLYNGSSAPTCSSASGIVGRFIIAATGAGFALQLPIPHNLTSGIGLCITSNISDTGTTASTSATVAYTAWYQQ